MYLRNIILDMQSQFVFVRTKITKHITKQFYKKQRGEALISYDGFVANVYQCHKSLSSRLILSTFIGFIAYC